MKDLFTSVFAFLLVQTAWSQTLLKSIVHDGIQRDYRIYVPSIYDGSMEVPVVFNIHGYGSNAFQQEAYGDFRPIADTANFILVAPDGTLDNSGTAFWNAFGSPTETVDDVGFISALIDTLAEDYSINLNRVYSTGMSNGGFMSYKLACGLSSRIAAIASVTGAMIDPAFLAILIFNRLQFLADVVDRGVKMAGFQLAVREKFPGDADAADVQALHELRAKLPADDELCAAAADVDHQPVVFISSQ